MNNSEKLWKEAKNILAGGVNSPVRAFKSVGGNPILIKRGKGSKIYDVDGKSYIDYVMSWGPLILGHANPKVINAVKTALQNGTSFGASHKAEIELAKLVQKAFPSIERIRFVSSGTEATMSAIRLARGFTGKDKIIKFEGCYHGHADSLLVKAGSGLATLGVPSSLGTTKGTTKDTIVLPYNNVKALERTVTTLHKSIACVIVEPIAGNMGLVLPKAEFLKKLREITKKYKIVLIFDEVISGFRLCFGGAQTIYKIKPDLTCLGKIIGGGFPVGAYGGKKEIMEFVSPSGGVYQAGTLSGNPVSLAAGIATITELQSKDFYKKLEKKKEKLVAGFNESIRKFNIPAVINHIGSMFTVFFMEYSPQDYQDVTKCNTKLFGHYFWQMIKNGVYLPPSQFETLFVSSAHTDSDIEATINSFHKWGQSQF